jgi:hypothetical protein
MGRLIINTQCVENEHGIEQKGHPEKRCGVMCDLSFECSPVPRPTFLAQWLANESGNAEQIGQRVYGRCSGWQYSISEPAIQSPKVSNN